MNSAADARKQREFSKLLGMAIHFRDNQEYQNALLILRKLARIRPHSASVHGILADVQWRLGHLERAVQSFKRATKLSPKSELASLGLFHTLWESGQIDRAKAEMKRYLANADSKEYALMASGLLANSHPSTANESRKKQKRPKSLANGKNSTSLKLRRPTRAK